MHKWMSYFTVTSQPPGIKPERITAQVFGMLYPLTVHVGMDVLEKRDA
jgi:hypothetical protein